jgi:hypothetical protein
MNLIDIHESFATEDRCWEYLEKMRWPDGVRCATCGGKDISRITSKSKKQKQRKLYQCLEVTCKQQFTVTSGTIFHDTHLPLTKWFLAVALITDAKKGISANQLQRHLRIGSYRTAWYLAHRIRKAMTETQEERAVLLKGTVEADETYVGGKYDPRRKRAKYDKPGVMGLVERKGRIRTMQLPEGAKFMLLSNVMNHTSPTATIYTDEHMGYKYVGKWRKHSTVCHIKDEWVRGNVHTNTIENFWSLFKRGMIGSFHKLSIKHLQRYMDEFQYRFNNRKAADLFIQTLARMCATSNLEYKKLTAKT